jgi:hypothetical protein
VRRFTTFATVAALVAAVVPPGADAHSFGRLYNLPVPFWMYAYGASAALLLSFLVAGWFLTVAESAPDTSSRQPRWRDAAWAQRLLPLCRGVALGGLMLCVITGLFGNADPFRNFNMTFFWIVFILGFSYMNAVAGNLYAALNPWRLLAQLIDRVLHGYARGRWRYPAALAYWPALALYMGFICVELFAHTNPRSLALYLLVYSALNLIGVGLIGAADWFRYCEFLSVFMRLLAKMAPVEYQAGRLRLRAPFAGLLEDHATHLSLLVFVLFMLSSTAYDGLSATRFWFEVFWLDPTGLLRAWFGNAPIMVFPKVLPLFHVFSTLCLLLSAFVYLAVYLACIAMAKLITRSPHSLMELALRFAYSLLPIVLVYNITHYYTLILTQGVQIVSLLSDPFGRGWNLFGTAGLFRVPFLPGMGLVWHSQVALILFGHIVSVVVAHLEALRVFPTRRAALLSQLPMLALMMLFTVVGLWILSQPMTGQ